MPQSPPNTSPTALPTMRRELVYALLKPVMRMAHLFRLPLGTVEELCRLAYFEEVRADNSQLDVARMFGKSLRTVGNLEKKYKTDFLGPAEELAFIRSVEEAFAHGPLTLEGVGALIDDADPSDVRSAVEALVGMHRLAADKSGQYELNRAFVSLVRRDLKARLDGLNHQLEVITEAVRSRFITPWRPARARTLSFVARPEHIEALGDHIVRALREHCTDAEESALRHEDYQRYAVTFALTPMEPEPNEEDPS